MKKRAYRQPFSHSLSLVPVAVDPQTTRPSSGAAKNAAIGGVLDVGGASDLPTPTHSRKRKVSSHLLAVEAHVYSLSPA